MPAQRIGARACPLSPHLPACPLTPHLQPFYQELLDRCNALLGKRRSDAGTAPAYTPCPAIMLTLQVRQAAPDKCLITRGICGGERQRAHLAGCVCGHLQTVLPPAWLPETRRLPMALAAGHGAACDCPP